MNDAKTAEPIEMHFGMLSRVQGSTEPSVRWGQHICSTWWIRLNRSCAETMRPIAK